MSYVINDFVHISDLLNISDDEESVEVVLNAVQRGWFPSDLTEKERILFMGWISVRKQVLKMRELCEAADQEEEFWLQLVQEHLDLHYSERETNDDIDSLQKTSKNQ